MKRLIFIIIILSLICFSAMALADDPVIGGNTYTWESCTVVFVQGPFGPGEGGAATVSCGDINAVVPWLYNPPILDLGGLKFVLVAGALYYIDPAGIVLIEYNK